MKFVVLILFVTITVSFCKGLCTAGVYELIHVPSQEEANLIVNLHNEKRLLIAHGKVSGQPRGVNLKKLKWDLDLAESAVKVARTCKFEHVKIKDKRFKRVGQNLHTLRSTSFEKGADWSSAINPWFEEHKHYTYSRTFTHGTGHYTQMVWADTTHVGCAYVHYPIHDSDHYHQKLYVCNYGPGGNIKGQFPYRNGTRGCENLC